MLHRSMSKFWPALEIRFAPAGAEASEAVRDRLTAALDDLRPTAIEERGLTWRIFFASRQERDAAAAAARSMSGLAAAAPLEVPDEDWARRSQESLAAVRVGRIVVAPPWAEPPVASPPSEGDLVVTILPSMGFGTGHHQTTRLCLSLLQGRGVSGLRVLDVGTGSGVLAIAAWRLGAASVVGVDDDEDAITAASENLALNGIREGVTLRHADFRLLTGLAGDVVLANLTGALLLRQAETLAGAVATGGSLIASGLTVEEEEQVASALGRLLSPAAREVEDEWVGLRFDRVE